MAKDSRLRRFTDRAQENGRGMWGVIDDEVEAHVDRRQKAHLAMLVAAVCLLAGVLTLLALFL